MTGTAVAVLVAVVASSGCTPRSDELTVVNTTRWDLEVEGQHVAAEGREEVEISSAGPGPCTSAELRAYTTDESHVAVSAGPFCDGDEWVVAAEDLSPATASFSVTNAMDRPVTVTASDVVHSQSRVSTGATGTLALGRPSGECGEVRLWATTRAATRVADWQGQVCDGDAWVLDATGTWTQDVPAEP